jgi:adenylate kinase family enzyme
MEGIMRKVTIIGNGGAGKSTLALALGERRGLPVNHLDQFVWKPDWQAISEPEFQQTHDQLIAGESWVIEGVGYDATIAKRFKRSDTIVYIDFPLSVHFLWVIKRSIKSLFVKPEGWADGCQPATKLHQILRIIWDIHQNTRPYLLALLTRQNRDIAIYHLRSPRDLNRFYKAHC